MVFRFGNPVSHAGASVTPAAGKTAEVDTIKADGNEVAVNLKNVSNAQTINITLLGVTGDGPTRNVVVPMGVLLGDVNASRRTDSGDVLVTRQQNLQPLERDNFRSDVNASGRIDAGDVLVIRKQNLSALP